MVQIEILHFPTSFGSYFASFSGLLPQFNPSNWVSDLLLVLPHQFNPNANSRFFLHVGEFGSLVAGADWPRKGSDSGEPNVGETREKNLPKTGEQSQNAAATSSKPKSPSMLVDHPVPTPPASSDRVVNHATTEPLTLSFAITEMFHVSTEGPSTSAKPTFLDRRLT